jgi:hypothetical protein
MTKVKKNVTPKDLFGKCYPLKVKRTKNEYWNELTCDG